MRPRIPENEKKVKCSISINKKINKLLEEVVEENEITKSTLIENLLIEYFKNNNIYTFFISNFIVIFYFCML